MKWVRSLVTDIQTTIDSQRAFVHDPQACEFFYVTDFNLYPLFKNATEDIILIEWDLALDREDRIKFEQYALADREHVQVAPYKHYSYKYARNGEWDNYSYMHRDSYYKFSEEGDPDCALFGFGLIYLPLRIMHEFAEFVQEDRKVDVWDGVNEKWKRMDVPKHMVADTFFSFWHAATHGRAAIHWDVRPVHLHYTEYSRVFEGAEETRKAWDNPILIRPNNAEALEELRAKSR